MNRVLLVLPNSRWFGRRPWMLLPHAPLIMTALLKPVCDFRILDCNIEDLDDSECLYRMSAIKPDVVLISGVGTEYWMQYHHVAEIAKVLPHQPRVILGGVYPTVLPDKALQDENIDHIFVGHAEDRIAPFIQAVLAGQDLSRFEGISYRDSFGLHTNPLHSTIFKAHLVKPDYSLMDLQGYINQRSKDYQFNGAVPTAPLISSYGCPFSCSFCAARTIHGQGVAYREVTDVVEEMRFLLGAGVRQFVFLDDCLTAKRFRFDMLLTHMTAMQHEQPFTFKIASTAIWQLDDLIIQHMKDAGCSQVTVSIESGSQRVLDEVMHKPLKLDGSIKQKIDLCRSLGIDIGANYVIGNPGETWQEIRQTFRHAEEMNFDLAHFHIATPLPKTKLYEDAKAGGYLPDDFSFFDERFFGYGRAWLTTPEWTPEELMVLRAYEYDRINFSTPEKEAKVAQMMCISVEELREHARQTRRKCGIHI